MAGFFDRRFCEFLPSCLGVFDNWFHQFLPSCLGVFDHGFHELLPSTLGVSDPTIIKISTQPLQSFWPWRGVFDFGIIEFLTPAGRLWRWSYGVFDHVGECLTLEWWSFWPRRGISPAGNLWPWNYGVLNTGEELSTLKLWSCSPWQGVFEVWFPARVKNSTTPKSKTLQHNPKLHNSGIKKTLCQGQKLWIPDSKALPQGQKLFNFRIKTPRQGQKLHHSKVKNSSPGSKTPSFQG